MIFPWRFGSRRPAWLDEIESAQLETYQKNQLKIALEEIERLFPDPAERARARVLDIGCNPLQDRLLSKYVGHVTGTNLGGMENEGASEKTRFLNSAERELPLEDGSVDFAFSLNIMEHLADTRAMIAEHVRVVKPGGYGFIDWACSWGSPSGHHIFEAMVRYWETVFEMPQTAFKDGGEFVPDWGHLLLSREEMRAHVLKRLGPGTEKLVDYIVYSIYDRVDQYGLSRLFLDEVMEIIRSFDIEIVEVKNEAMPAPKPIKLALETLHGEHDYETYHTTVTFRKPATDVRAARKAADRMAAAT